MSKTFSASILITEWVFQSLYSKKLLLLLLLIVLQVASMMHLMVVEVTNLQNFPYKGISIEAYASMATDLSPLSDSE